MSPLIRLTSALVIAGAVGAALASADDRPNIVLLFADDLGYGDLSSYGSTLSRTPAIDSLGRTACGLPVFMPVLRNARRAALPCSTAAIRSGWADWCLVRESFKELRLVRALAGEHAWDRLLSQSTASLLCTFVYA